jgi:hypothetical protein
MKSKLWIATSGIPLNKDLRYDAADMEGLFLEVMDRTSIRRNYDQSEEAFSCLLANLSNAEVLNRAVIYSRDTNDYVIERERYGYGWYKYGQIVRLVDSMYELGLVEGVKGRILANGKPKPSKIWASEELVDLFRQWDGRAFIKRTEEVIFLKDADKLLRDYRNNGATRRMREQLHELNRMLGSLEITFTFNYSTLSSRPKPRVSKLMKLRSMLHHRQIEILPREIILPSLYERENFIAKLYERESYTDKPYTKYYTVLDHDAFLSNEIGKLEFICRINSDANYMRRIFNVDWQHGGRFYHAPHITIPSACRKAMFIDGEPAVELDYSGLHVRMLYNLIGIDYRGECYVYEKADRENKPERERIKLASLIVINSSERRKAIRAVHNQCRKKGLHYPSGQYGRYSALVDRFEQHHEPIRQFFLSGKGLELQFLDSCIMENILGRMTSEGIPALPVHDSVICPARHEGFLRQVMVEEYQKVMGFEPVIG